MSAGRWTIAAAAVVWLGMAAALTMTGSAAAGPNRTALRQLDTGCLETTLGQPAGNAGATDPAAVSAFGVLGHPRNASDVIPATLAQLDQAGGLGGALEVDGSAARVLRRDGSTAWFLMPAVVGVRAAPARCAGTPVASVVRDRTELTGTGPGVCLVVHLPAIDPRLQASCISLAQLRSYADVMSAEVPVGDPGAFLVPDGIGSVTLSSASGRSRTEPVSDNLARLPGSSPAGDRSRVVAPRGLAAMLPTAIQLHSSIDRPDVTLHRPSAFARHLGAVIAAERHLLEGVGVSHAVLMASANARRSAGQGPGGRFASRAAAQEAAFRSYTVRRPTSGAP